MDKTISYLVHENEVARLERFNVRLWILSIILLIMLLATNFGWLYYENQYEDVVVTQEAQSDGNSEINLQNIGGDYNGR